MGTDHQTVQEPIAYPDAFVMDVKIEDLPNGMRRLVWMAPHSTRGGTEMHVAANLVIPAACIVTICEKLLPHAQEVVESLLTLVPRSNNHTTG